MKYRHPILRYTIVFLHIAGLNPMKTTFFSVLRAIWNLSMCAILLVLVLLELSLNFQGFHSFTRSIGLLPAVILVNIGEFYMLGVLTPEVFVKIVFLSLHKKELRVMIHKTQKNLSDFYLHSINAIGEENMNQVYTFFKFYVWGVATYILQISVQTVYTKTPPILTYNEQKMSGNYWRFVYFVNQNFFVFASLSFHGYNWLFLFFVTYIVSEMKMLNAALREMFNDIDSEDFKILVDHHNHILSCVKELNNNYSSTLLLEHTLNFLSLCFSLFCMNMDGFPPDREHIMSYGIYAALFMVNLFLYNYAGDVLTSECEKVSTTFFYKVMEKPLNKNAEFVSFMMVGRGQKKSNIRIGSFWDSNMETFHMAMGQCFSFLTFMQALRDRDRKP